MGKRSISVMISSTRADLLQYRQEASKVIKNVASEKEKLLQLIEVSMEKETMSGDLEFAVEVSKRWVEQSDWIVLIIGWNYGTISNEPGANQLSVTEWEYQHAVSKGKKVFPFIAGEPDSATEYRVSSDERPDLKNWMQSGDQSGKLKQFKQVLTKHHIEFFKDIHHFSERFTKTLREAIDDLPPEILRGSRLAELIVAVAPAIRDCIRQVNLIADCKKVHDHLHELRQRVIRRLREEVLPRWREAGVLNRLQEGVIGKRWSQAERRLGAIENLQNSIGAGNNELLGTLRALLKIPPLWDAEAAAEADANADSQPDIDQFSSATDDFAEAVEAAFTAADSAMQREERAFDILHAALLEGISEARRQQQLSAPDEKTLNDELKKVGDNKTRLAIALAKHHEWQQAHDKLEGLQAFRETDLFAKRLARFVIANLDGVRSLVDQEIAYCIALEGSDPGAIQVAGSPSTVETSLADARADLLALKDRVGELTKEGDGEAFDRMRVSFDNAFYRIDKRTLDDVTRSRERVVAFEGLLGNLAKAQAKAA